MMFHFYRYIFYCLSIKQLSIVKTMNTDEFRDYDKNLQRNFDRVRQDARQYAKMESRRIKEEIREEEELIEIKECKRM